MKEEIWEPIEGYEGIYEFSNLGRVRTWRRTFANAKKELPHYIKLNSNSAYALYKKGGGSISKSFAVKSNLKKYFPETHGALQ